MSASFRKRFAGLVILILISPVLSTALQRSAGKFFPTSTRPITSIYFTDAQHGWATTDCDTLLYTEDGGQNWKVHPQKFYFTPGGQRLYFTDGGLGWIFPEYRTTDGGQTWSEFVLEQDEWDENSFFPSPPLPLPYHPTDRRPRTDESIANMRDKVAKWLREKGTQPYKDLVIGVDSSTSVSTEPISLEPARTSHGSFTIQTFYFSNNQHGWVKGYIRRPQGKDHSDVYALLSTSNGGRNWRVVREIKKEDFWGAISFSDAQHGWVTALADLYRTTDGGRTWQKRTISKPELHDVGSPARVVPISANDCLVLTHYHNIFRTTDGGQTWQLAKLVKAPKFHGDPFMSDRGFTDLKMVNDREGWLLEDLAGPQATALYYTSDGGLTWKYTGRVPGVQLGAFFRDRQRGWLFGHHNKPISYSPLLLSVRLWHHSSSLFPYGIIVHTNDAGRRWQSQEIAEEEKLKLKDRTPPEEL